MTVRRCDGATVRGCAGARVRALAVLALVNRKQVAGKGFTQKESGGILMDDDTRKTSSPD